MSVSEGVSPHAFEAQIGADRIFGYARIVRSFEPHPALRTRVLAIDIVETVGGENLVLPSTSAVLGFQFRGRVRTADHALSIAGVTGLQNSARSYSYVGDTGSVLVRFTPQGLSCLGVSAVELADRSLALEDLLGAGRVAQTQDRLQAANDDRARVAVVEQFLLDLPFARDPAVTRALELLGEAPEPLGIAAIARKLDMSERQLERRFVARVGLTPKRFARLVRFERALALVRSSPSLCTAAQSAGYYDQSHLIREFRSFAGVLPSEIAARSR